MASLKDTINTFTSLLAKAAANQAKSNSSSSGSSSGSSGSARSSGSSNSSKYSGSSGASKYSNSSNSTAKKTSVENVKTSSAQEEAIRQQMAKNSAAWHTADETTRKQLEAENKRLSSQISGMSFDSSTGTWSNTGGSSKSSGSSNSSSSGRYTPINSYAAEGVNQNAYENEVKKQQQYIYNNPTAATPMTNAERNAIYGDLLADVVKTGYVTDDYNAAMAAQAKYGVEVKRTVQNGQVKYIVGKAERTTPTGESGADAGNMDDYDYAVIQYEKQQFADAQARYNQAKASGNTAAMAQAQADMDQAHLNAERIRARYNYSGGQDGSMYMDYSLEAAKGNMDVNTEQAKRWLNAKGVSTSGISGSTGTWSPSGAGTSSGSSSSGSSGGASGSTTQTGSATLAVPEAEDLTDQIHDQSAYLEQIYAARKAAALAQLKSAYEQNVNAINRAGEGVDEAYQSARNQTAGASELAKRNFAEYAAAAGLNSGTGGQAELARNVTLQNNLNAINAEEAQTLADLELQRANAETEYNNAIAQAEAEGDYQLAQALYQEKVRVENAIVSAMTQEYQNALSKYQLEYQQQREQVSDRQWQQSFDFQKQQYSDNLALQQESLALQQQQWEDELAFQQQQYADAMAQAEAASSGSSSGGGSGADGDYQDTIRDTNGYSINDYKELYAQARAEGNAGLMQAANDGANAIRAALGIAGEYATEDIAKVAAASAGGQKKNNEVTSGETVSTPTSTGSYNETSYHGSEASGRSPASGASGVGYDNDWLTTGQVKKLQGVIGVAQDGYYGPESKTASGGLSAGAAYNRYVVGNGVGSDADYGSAYIGAVATARLMQADGKSNGEIFDELEKYSTSQVTAAGMDSILKVLGIGGY